MGTPLLRQSFRERHREWKQLDQIDREKFPNSPQLNHIIMTIEQPPWEISINMRGSIVRHNELLIVLICCTWITILQEKETEKDETIQDPKRD